MRSDADSPGFVPDFFMFLSRQLSGDAVMKIERST